MAGTHAMLQRLHRKTIRVREGLRTRRAVRPHLDLPNMGGSGVYAILLVRDEADTIGFVLDHLLGQGVDQVLVIDHRSNDETPRIVAGYQSSQRVALGRYTHPGYFQSTVMTYAARHCARAGADWIVPVDADELWFAPEGCTLAEYLEASPYCTLKAQSWDYIPTPEDDMTEPNPFARIVMRRAQPSGHWAKRAFRAHRRVEVAMGNHHVRRPGPAGDGLVIAHYPFRSREQFERKITQGVEALNAANFSSPAAEHWRELGDQLDSEALWDLIVDDGDVPTRFWPRVGHLVRDPYAQMLRCPPDGASS